MTTRQIPVQPAGPSGIAALALGLQHTVAVSVDGIVWTWGSSSFGQLNRSGFVGGLNPREDRAHGTSQQVFPRTA